MTNAITSEPSLRYQVQTQYRKAPPAPYENPWRLLFSFDEIEDASECARDEDRAENFYVYRVVDGRTDEVVA